MPWPVHPTGFFGARGDSDTYRIERSLRFNSADSAYLSRTPASAGNRKTFTISLWLKRSALLGSLLDFAFINSGDGTTIGISGTGAFGASLDNTVFLRNGGSNVGNWSALFRDVSAWYHFVVAIDSTQATDSNRQRLYVNGVDQGNCSGNLGPSADTSINTAALHVIGGFNSPSAGYYANGYLAEYHFIDGQALTPSSFGETDAITGRWKAKAYSGTYGTNGFYLKFADNSGATATTLGKDSSGNGNNWTPNNFSVTAGAGNDSLVDSPTNYGSDSGVGGEVRGNYCTLNPLHYNYDGVDLRNGNLDGYGVLTTTTPSARTYPSTIKIKSGKWYVELTVNATSNGHVLGIANTFDSYGNISYSDGYGYNFWDQVYLSSGGSLSYGVRATAGQVVGMAVDLDNGKLEWFVNGSSQGQKTGIISGEYFIAYYLARGTAGTVQSGSINFGQRPFAYTAPTGFKALCTQNLTQPTIQKPSTAMDVVTYTGNGTSPRTISGFGFSPDFLWVKNRTDAYNHIVYDTVRGAGSDKGLSTNTTKEENNTDNTNYGYVSAFTSDGFSVTTGAIDYGLANTNSKNYVAWSWDAGSTNSTNTSGSITSTVRANPQAGFSICTLTASTSAFTFGHGLGVVPSMVIMKDRNNAISWWVSHKSIGLNTLQLNSTAAQFVGTYWGTHTSTVVNVSNPAGFGMSASPHVAYVFSEIEGYSKFGSYTGNGSSDGPFVWCGFRPRWVMTKRTDNSFGGDWYIYDSARNTFNAINNMLYANGSDAESSVVSFDFTANGFKVRSSLSNYNASGGTYIFAAFAESAFKYCRAR